LFEYFNLTPSGIRDVALELVETPARRMNGECILAIDQGNDQHQGGSG